ncbi:MAG: Fur family transcriptional regulator [Thermodesulfovibrionales bacterium]
MAKSAATQEDIRGKLLEVLRKNNLKVTRQRREIIEVLAGDKSHPSARAILAAVRRKVPSVSLSTVYYTLNLFKKEGAVRELEFYEMENRYESKVRDHLNLVCVKCGKIEDYAQGVPVTAGRVEKETGFAVDRVRFEYHGHCRDCRKKGR